MLTAVLAAAAILLPQGPALEAAIAAEDEAFFRLFFEQCDPAAMEARLTPDFEMYHDREGRVAGGAAAFVAGYAKACEARKAPDAWRSRRVLVPGTMVVNPIPGVGAVQEGRHDFLERKGDGPEKLVGSARFVQLWVYDGTRWRLSRVFSLSHESR